MCHITQPECPNPKCKSHKYKIIYGPRHSKTRYGSDVEKYSLQCLKCNEIYEWLCPLGWNLSSEE